MLDSAYLTVHLIKLAINYMHSSLGTSYVQPVDTVMPDIGSRVDEFLQTREGKMTFRGLHPLYSTTEECTLEIRVLKIRLRH